MKGMPFHLFFYSQNADTQPVIIIGMVDPKSLAWQLRYISVTTAQHQRQPEEQQ
jgi:hypothetical protein